MRGNSDLLRASRNSRSYKASRNGAIFPILDNAADIPALTETGPMTVGATATRRGANWKRWAWSRAPMSRFSRNLIGSAPRSPDVINSVSARTPSGRGRRTTKRWWHPSLTVYFRRPHAGADQPLCLISAAAVAETGQRRCRPPIHCRRDRGRTAQRRDHPARRGALLPLASARLAQSAGAERRSAGGGFSMAGGGRPDLRRLADARAAPDVRRPAREEPSARIRSRSFPTIRTRTRRGWCAGLCSAPCAVRCRTPMSSRL